MNDGYMSGASTMPGSKLFGYDYGMFYKRLREIEEMTDPKQREEAIQQLARDFPGEIADLQAKNKTFEQMATRDIRSGATTAGPASNPFAVAVADPLGSIADAVEKGVGMKRMNQNYDLIGALRGDKQREVEKVMAAGMNPAQQPSSFGIGPLGSANPAPPGMDPTLWETFSEEEKRKWLMSPPRFNFRG